MQPFRQGSDLPSGMFTDGEDTKNLVIMVTTHMMRQLFPPIASLHHTRRDGADMGKPPQAGHFLKVEFKTSQRGCLLIRICVLAGGHIVHLFFSQHRAVGIHYLNGPLAGPGGQHVFT